MWRCTALLTTLAMLVGTSTAVAADRAKLRQASAMPHVAVMFGYGVKNGRFVAGDGKGDLPADIAALEKNLQGNGNDAAVLARLALLLGDAAKSDQANAVGSRAAEMLRLQYAAAPNDAWAMAQ